MSGNSAVAQALEARLRGLRERHPSLTVTTELLRLDDTLAAFRAVVALDGVPRASGHAASAAERSGAFVAAAELAAVTQALLLSGFDATSADSPAALFVGVEAPPVVADSPPPSRARRERDASPPAGVVPKDSAAMPDEVAPPTPPTPSRRAARRSKAGEAPAMDEPTPAVPANPPIPVPSEPQELPLEAAPVAVESDSPHSRRASRPRGDRQPKLTEAEPTPPDGDEPEVAALSPPEPPTEASATARLAPARRTRRTTPVESAQSQPNERVSDAPSPAADSSAPLTLERLQEAWRPGRPIPAWWPPAREANPKRLSRQQLARLETLGQAAELTTQQLDSYCHLLFHRGLPDLASWQAAVMLARLDPHFPTPLAEVRAGRILHPLAVGDFVPVADGQDGFIRWGELPATAREV